MHSSLVVTCICFNIAEISEASDLTHLTYLCEMTYMCTWLLSLSVQPDCPISVCNQDDPAVTTLLILSDT